MSGVAVNVMDPDGNDAESYFGPHGTGGGSFCACCGSSNVTAADKMEKQFDWNDLHISFAGEKSFPKVESRPTRMPPSGCGFLGIYHVGVAAAFRSVAPDIKFTKLCGASAGSLVATALAGDVDICE